MFVRTNAGGYLNLAHVVSITPNGEAGSGNWLIHTTNHAPGQAAAHEIDPDDLAFSLGHLIPAAPDAGFAHLLSYSRFTGAVETTRAPIIAWWFPPDGSVYALPVTPDFPVLDQASFTVSDKTFRWVLTEVADGGFKGSNGGFYNSVDEAKAELLSASGMIRRGEELSPRTSRRSGGKSRGSELSPRPSPTGARERGQESWGAFRAISGARPV